MSGTGRAGWPLRVVLAVGGLAAVWSLTPRATAAEPPRPPAFEAIVLGASGGIDESDLSSVLVARAGQDRYLALDAGTLWVGLRRAVAEGLIAGPPEVVLRQRVVGVCLSHPHLDHVAGLVITSPEDGEKTLYGLPSTLDAVREHLFNGRIWANFTDEGPGAIGRYHLRRMTPGAVFPVTAAPGLTVEALPLSHGPGTTSTAFLVSAGDDALLYLGDTGPDAIEGAGRLGAVWERVAPLVRARRLRALFVEASYPDPRPDSALFGHLTPTWIARELASLAARVDAAAPERALVGLTVVITHIKPSLAAAAGPLTGPPSDARAQVARQVAPLASRGMRVIVPRPGERLSL